MLQIEMVGATFCMTALGGGRGGGEGGGGLGYKSRLRLSTTFQFRDKSPKKKNLVKKYENSEFF